VPSSLGRINGLLAYKVLATDSLFSQDLDQIQFWILRGRHGSEGVENFRRSRLVDRAALANPFHSSMPKQSLTRFSVGTIIHRDLKPANVKITPDGTFGPAALAWRGSVKFWNFETCGPAERSRPARTALEIQTSTDGKSACSLGVREASEVAGVDV